MFFENIFNAPISIIFSLTSIALSLLLNLQLLDSFQIYFDKKLIFEYHEFWRLFSSIFCFGQIDTTTVINLIFYINSLIRVETSFFNEKPADFILFSLFGWTFIWIFAYFNTILFLGDMFDYYIFYYYLKLFPENNMILIVFPVMAQNVPILLLILAFIFGGKKSFLTHLVSFAISHVYFFIKNVIGLKYNLRIFCMPQWANDGLKKLLN